MDSIFLSQSDFFLPKSFKSGLSRFQTIYIYVNFISQMSVKVLGVGRGGGGEGGGVLLRFGGGAGL